MPCDIKIQITSLLNMEGSNGRTFKKQVTGSKVLLKGVSEDEVISLDNVVDMVMNLSKAERQNLASRLKEASTVKLTDKDAKNFNFISNTTPEELLDAYPDLKEEYSDVVFPLHENVTIVRCNKMTLNGESHYGRYYDSQGNPIFFLSNKWAVQSFLQYYRSKLRISENFDESKYDLQVIIDHFKAKDGKSLLLDFLDNKSKYKSFKDKGKVIDTVKVLNDVIADISGTSSSNKSGLFLALENESSKGAPGKNRYVWEIGTKDLYSVLRIYFEDALKEHNINSINDFNAMSSENIEKLLENLFESDIRLMQARVQSISEGTSKDVQTEGKTVNISQKDLGTIWQTIRKNKGLKRQALSAAIEENPTQITNYFKEYFKVNGYTDESLVYTDVNVSVLEEDGKKKLVATYKNAPNNTTKYGNRRVKLTFPWSQLGNFHGFAWNTKAIWQPVRKEEGTLTEDFDEDGKYHGVYIYEYFNPKSNRTEYAISRHLISPSSPAYLYSSLENAKNKIDEWNSKQTIREHSLYVLKLKRDDPRISPINFPNILVGQVITSLNAELPSLTLPSFLQRIFNGTLPEFYLYFKNVERIKELNTPEKAAIFIYKFYEHLKDTYKEQIKARNYSRLNFDDLVVENIEVANSIIDGIHLLVPIHYLVETFIPSTNTGSNLGFLRKLPNNGTLVELGESTTEIIKNPTITDMENAAEYFKSKYGLNIEVLSKDDLEEFISQNPNIKIGADTRAFVLNGKIYINGSKANTSDMFHEVGHIFLGLIKAKNRAAYYKIIEGIKQSDLKKFNKRLSSIKLNYGSMSLEDLYEEAAVTVMAEASYGKSSMVRGFVGTDFDNEYRFIYEQVRDEFNAIINQDPILPLDFQGLVLHLLSDGDVMSTMDKNMRIANFVKELMHNHKIKEFDCK